jgi:hypothetical protein
LNTCVIIKHAVRGHERDDFLQPPYIATKIILPFDRANLGLGGARCSSASAAGRRRCATWREAPTSPATPSCWRRSDELPSLDPFLLREHLTRRGFTIGSCYFDISPADVERMQRFVSDEIGDLIRLAFQGAKGAPRREHRPPGRGAADQPAGRPDGAAAPDAAPRRRRLQGRHLQLEGLPLLQVGALDPGLADRRGLGPDQGAEALRRDVQEISAEIGNFKLRLVKDVDGSRSPP